MANEEALERLERRVRRPRLRYILLGVLALLLILVLALWTQRRQIAADYIAREFDRRGVRATYEVDDIGFRTQRLRNLVIGDPANPDLRARRVLVEVSLGLRRPRGVRLHGRIVNGKLTLGEVDKLLPPPTGAPFRLPDQAIDVADAALRLDTPVGRVGIAIEGRGNLSDGFRGRMAAAAPRLALSGCTVQGMRAATAVAVDALRPSFDGPVAAEQVLCPRRRIAFAGPRADVDVVFAQGLDRWQGGAALQLPRARLGSDALADLGGSVRFDGSARLTRGDLRLSAREARAGGFGGRDLALGGRYAVSARQGEFAYQGGASAATIVAGTRALRPAAAALNSFGGTPLAPIGQALAGALSRAGSAFQGRADINLYNGRSGGSVQIRSASASSRSGARLALAGGNGFTYAWPEGRGRLAGDFALTGGGFPDTRISLSSAAGGALSGTARIGPMAAGGARLQLAPVRFAAGGGGVTRIDTIATVEGPIPDGRVEGLVLPVSGSLGNGGFAFGERCTPVSFRALRTGSLQLGASRMPLCPSGRALLWSNGGSVQGGAEIRSPRFAGRLGGSPLSYAADRLRYTLGDNAFASTGTRIRLGSPGFVNRLDLATLTGRITARGVSGAFAGADAKIGTVPVLVSGGRGRWSFARGALAVDGAITVSDDAPNPRFHPLAANDFRLSLRDNIIAAGGWLTDPETGTRVSLADISHSLATGRGRAVLDVPGISFTEQFQPEALTRLTTGVVALVRGTVTGRGEIAWSREGTTSTGAFSTEGMNLAANFGPVEGLTTTIRFSDLLGLETAPGQAATVAVIRTGIDVFDGNIRYQLLPGLRVRVEGGRWPYAGGELALEETILDFSQPSPKRLTFRVAGLDAATFVQLFQFSNISATGTFDGIVPMVFDERGGRIAAGHLEARPEGGTLSYIGELTDKDLGTYGKLAFDALKSMRYSKLIIDLDGSLEGEFLSRIELDGIARDPVLTTAPAGGGISTLVANRALGQLAKIPFEFNITVRGPFRALLATARSLEDPTLLIQSVLPEMLRDQPVTTTVQPQESETVP
jgi:hypothetical protein